VDEYEKLDLIGNVRADSVIYDLAPQPTEKRAGQQYTEENCPFRMISHCQIKNDKYYMAIRRVLTNIFGRKKVIAYLTSPEKNSKARRLFFSTIFPEQLEILCMWHAIIMAKKSPLNQIGSDRMQYISILLYMFRWNIDVSYFE